MAEHELLTIFNEQYIPVGVATRSEVHQKGHWHETFHCWFYTIENDELILYFQKRATQKKDFPDMLDITAAGHLLAGETITDGFREVREELGLDITSDEVQFLGVFPVQIELGGFKDNEFTNVHLVNSEIKLGEFDLQEEEVAGIFPVTLSEFKNILSDRNETISLTGWCQKEKRQYLVQESFLKRDFCVNAATYYDRLIQSLEKILENQRRTID